MNRKKFQTMDGNEFVIRNNSNQPITVTLPSTQSISDYPKPEWKMAPTGDFFSLTLHIHKAPNRFYRFMQRVILGIRYEKL